MKVSQNAGFRPGFLKLIRYFLNQTLGPQIGQLGENPPETFSARHSSEYKRGFPGHESIIQTELQSQSWLFPHFPHTFVKTCAVRRPAIITVIITISYCRVKHISYNYIKTLLTILLKYLGFLQYLPVFPQLKEIILLESFVSPSSHS